MASTLGLCVDHGLGVMLLALIVHFLSRIDLAVLQNFGLCVAATIFFIYAVRAGAGVLGAALSRSRTHEGIPPGDHRSVP